MSSPSTNVAAMANENGSVSPGPSTSSSSSSSSQSFSLTPSSSATTTAAAKLAGEVFAGGATTSQHVEAEDDSHFENTTFKLKRTRSMGLLDEFIDPEKQAEKIEEKNSKEHQHQHQHQHQQQLQEVEPETAPVVLPEVGARSGSPAVTEDGLQLTTTLTSPEILPYDDTDIHTEPSRHVDYFSHKWDVSDIYKSWRYVIQKRKDVANAARLENASWRTWAQRRSNLKTISPEVVNWSKDNDITWLYGPILKNEDHWDNEEDDDESDDAHCHKRETTATSKVAGDISIPQAPKPILKRRTVQAQMISHSNLLKWELLEKKVKQRQEHEEDMRILAEEKAAEEAKLESQKKLIHHHRRTNSQDPPDFNDFDAISAKLNTQYRVSSDADLKSLPRQGSTNSLIAATLDKHIRGGEVKGGVSETAGNESGSASIASFLMVDQEQQPTHVEDALATPNNAINNDIMAIKEEQGSLEAIDVLPCHSPESIILNNLTPSSSLAPTMIKSSSMKMSALTSSSSKKERHIHFNEEVQQCIAVDIYSDVDADTYYDDADVDDDYYYDDEDEDEDEEEDYIYETSGPNGEGEGEDDEEDDDEDDEGGFFIDVRSSANAPDLTKNNATSPGNALPLPSSSVDVNTEDTESISTNSSKVYKTIHLLPSTQINYGSSEEESDEENPYTSSVSHNASNRGYDYYYDYNSVYTVDPNHSIYGVNSNSSKIIEPDVVDVPDGLAIGSNFDYEIIDAPQMEVLNGALAVSGSNTMPIIEPSLNINFNHQPASSNTFTLDQVVQSHLTGDASQQKETPFQLSDSESDSDDGLSISTSRSSQALVEQAFNQELTSSNNQMPHLQQPQPQPAPIDAEHILLMNSSDASIKKQPSSLSSLSELFFGTNTFTKKDPSRTSLADQFFGTALTSTSENNNDSSKSNTTTTTTTTENPTSSLISLGMFFSSPPSSPIYRAPTDSTVHSKVPSGVSIESNSPGYMSAQLYESLTGGSQCNPPQRKVSPLPPHTTSTNAFLGFRNTSQNSRTEGGGGRGSDDIGGGNKGAFVFDSESSDEDEFIEDVRSHSVAASSVPGASRTQGGGGAGGSSSYSTLSYVADMNGIAHTPPDESPNSMTSSPSNILGQAKGLANQLLGNWKNDNH
ncbi:uncharacterized protein KQ657_004265 [Scheffersomyces spartinae]|uniref:Nitrogen regulatory protein areA GATA-like domain-containing protein n=1 Tax=Scheffersomyces spartinae TaxID=45513 RepID=A0A9P7VC38_9ASCO|nr:uncharacterized protein KQ657_004265 [Scheffersomyces spartinae]KAG7194589.1 hypothetical protein KQ657_004265 [Scheffersomyces spartinae]